MSSTITPAKPAQWQAVSPTAWLYGQNICLKQPGTDAQLRWRVMGGIEMNVATGAYHVTVYLPDGSVENLRERYYLDMAQADLSACVHEYYDLIPST